MIKQSVVRLSGHNKNKEDIKLQPCLGQATLNTPSTKNPSPKGVGTFARDILPPLKYGGGLLPWIFTPSPFGGGGTFA